MGTFRETLAEGTEGALHLGPERPRVYSDLSPEDKERYNADIRATNILLQGLPKDIYSLINHYTDAKDIWDNVKMLLEGSELTKEDRESQLYDDFEHFRQHKGETIHDYYVRFAKLINDMRNIKMTMSRMQLNSKFVNNMLPEWGRFVTAVKLNKGATGYEGAKNRVENNNLGQPRQVKCYNCNGIGRIARNYTQPKRPQNSEYLMIFNDMFELTKREQKIDEQLRIVINDRNIKEKNLKKELHSIKMQLASTINYNKSMVEEVTSLKKDFKHKENKYLEEFLDMKALKEKVEDKLYKQDEYLQTVHMLSKPKPYYNEQNKVAIGYKNPLCLTRAKQVQSALYNGYEIIKNNNVPALVHNTLGYPNTLRNVSAMSVNAFYQPWRAVLSMINMCLTDRKNLAIASRGKKKTALLLIPNVKFTKLIIHHLRTKHNIYPRTGLPLHYSHDENVLNTLRTWHAEEGGAIESSKATKVTKLKEAKVTKPAGDPAPKKRKLVKETPDDPLPAKRSKAGLVGKRRKAKSPLRLIDEPGDEGVPVEEPAHDNEEADLQRAMKLKVQGKGKEKVVEEQAAHDLLTLQTPKKKSPIEQFIFQRCPPMPTESYAHAESPSMDAELNLTDSETESDEEASKINTKNQEEGQAGPNPSIQDEVQAGPNPGVQYEGQAGPNPGITAESQLQSSHVVHVGPNLEHMDLGTSDASTQQKPEQIDEEFTTTAYPNVQENLKLPTEDQVILEEPASSTGTLSSLQNLKKDLSFTDQFFIKKLQEEELGKTNVEAEVQLMVPVPIHQDTSSVPPITTLIIDLMTMQSDSPLPTSTATTSIITTITSLPLPPQPQQSTTDLILVSRIGELEQHMADLIQNNLVLKERLDKQRTQLYNLENLNIPYKVSQAVDEIVTDAVDWAMQAPLRVRFRDLPIVDMKEIIQQRMFKDDSYIAHTPPPPPPPAGASGAPGTLGASGSSQLPPPPPLLSTSTSGSAHQQGNKAPTGVFGTHKLSPNDSLRQDDSIPKEQTIPSSNKSDVMNNWASALAITYEHPAENSLLAKIGDMTTFLKRYCRQVNKTTLTQADFKGQAYEVVNPEGDQVRINVNQPLPLSGPPGHVTIQTQFFFNKDLEYLRYGSKESCPALLISKMKAANYPDFGLELLVSEQMWIDDVCTYDISAKYGISHWWFTRQKFYIDRHDSLSRQKDVRTHMRILSVFIIKAYSRYEYDYLSEIILRRADHQEHTIAKNDFKNLYPSDFEDLNLLLLQGHLDHLSGSDKRMLSTVVKLWTQNLVIRQRVKDFQLGLQSQGIQDQAAQSGYEYAILDKKGRDKEQ
ncbi:hypothetical protein Tco_0222382 [Tanacetum coccineum]